MSNSVASPNKSVNNCSKNKLLHYQLTTGLKDTVIKDRRRIRSLLFFFPLAVVKLPIQENGLGSSQIDCYKSPHILKYICTLLYCVFVLKISSFFTRLYRHRNILKPLPSIDILLILISYCRKPLFFTSKVLRPIIS